MLVIYAIMHAQDWIADAVMLDMNNDMIIIDGGLWSVCMVYGFSTLYLHTVWLMDYGLWIDISGRKEDKPQNSTYSMYSYSINFVRIFDYFST